MTDTNETPKKVKYTSRSLERHIRAPREHAWRVLLEAIETGVGGYAVEGDPAPHGVGAQLRVSVGDGAPLLETVLSFEPPWRRSYRVEGDFPLDFYEGTFVLRDDGDECHLSWGVVVDPEPTDEGWEFLESAMTFIGRFMDHVVERAQA